MNPSARNTLLNNHNTTTTTTNNNHNSSAGSIGACRSALVRSSSGPTTSSFGNLFHTTSMSSSSIIDGNNNNQRVGSNPFHNNDSRHQQQIGNSFSAAQNSNNIHQTHNHTSAVTPASLFSTVFSQTTLNNVNSVVEDENQLNRQFVQSANSVAQFYTMSLQSYRKSHQQGVRKAIRRISTMLLQYCNLHHQHTPLNTPYSNIQIPVETILGFLNQVLQEEISSTQHNGGNNINSTVSASSHTTSPSTSASQQHHHATFTNSNMANNSSDCMQHHQRNVSLNHNANSQATPSNDVTTTAATTHPSETDSMMIITNSDNNQISDSPSVQATDCIHASSSSGNTPNVDSTHKLSPLSGDTHSPSKAHSSNNCEGANMSPSVASSSATTSTIQNTTNTEAANGSTHNTIPPHPFSFSFQFSSPSSQPIVTNPSTSSSFDLNFSSDFSFASALMSGNVSTLPNRHHHRSNNGGLHPRYHYTFPSTHNTSLKRSADEFLGLNNACEDDEEEDDVPTFLFRTINASSNNVDTTVNSTTRLESSTLGNLSGADHCPYPNSASSHSLDISAGDISQELSPLTQFFKKNRI
ncbi:hypothetical protein FDP41_004017 [Naegleria fowleri]|uniref:Uncharacterized protein n=1 Tax=Naegleria fowleri TaxID=5763 RepID=A0A6A5BPJ6_NAEFO|nr:uncharacterized protein FDP41_004017 [Naegleria fowleri]KAF0976722.1 hypothetical protein FDP41_004017 [Naegleria fowleri]